MHCNAGIFGVLMMKKIAQIFLLGMLILPIFLFGEKKKKKLPNQKLYFQIQQIWMSSKNKNLEPLLAKRVMITLAKYRGRYPKRQIVGILKRYFQHIKILYFRYNYKRTSIDRGIVEYHYQVRRTGVIYKKKLYFYLRLIRLKKSRVKKWFIVAINEI